MWQGWYGFSRANFAGPCRARSPRTRRGHSSQRVSFAKRQYFLPVHLPSYSYVTTIKISYFFGLLSLLCITRRNIVIPRMYAQEIIFSWQIFWKLFLFSYKLIFNASVKLMYVNMQIRTENITIIVKDRLFQKLVHLFNFKLRSFSKIKIILYFFVF